MYRQLRITLPIAVPLILCVLAAPVIAQPNADDEGRTHAIGRIDIVLAGGQLYLGDGESPQQGDVAIRGDKIVAVGDFNSEHADYRIDCTGLVVCPGFIDLHNHSDDDVVSHATQLVANYLTQGCTTVVTGNCGSGPIDVDHYFDTIDRQGVGLNVAHLLPQGALRRAVIGLEEREATVHELRRMKQLVQRAMDDGAYGMSTGLIYVPSSYASTDELAELASVVGQAGGIYVSHIRNENVELLSAVDEALDIGQKAGLPVHISHFKSSGKDSWGLVRTAVQVIEQHRAAGRIVTADQYPYTASNTSLTATLVPAWARSGGTAKLLERLEDPQVAPKIFAAIDRKLIELDDGQRLQLARFPSEPSWAGKRLLEIANQRQVSSREMALYIIRNGGASVVNHSINEADVRFVMQLPWVACASDGSGKLPGPTVPHPRSYGTFSRRIGHYARDEKVTDLATAIRSCTGLPADILGLQDRGYLRVGLAADIAVFDAQRFSDQATFTDPHQHSTGLVHLLVNGRLAVNRGRLTGSLVGRALRKPVISSAKSEAIDQLLNDKFSDTQPGASVGVVHRGRLVYARGVGLANLDDRTPLTVDSAFYLASLSKQFVAACIGLLELEGKLSSQDPARKWLPEMPAYETEITIAHLLNHTSGLPGYFALMQREGLNAADQLSRDALIDLVVKQKQLNFTPGDKYEYSNSGYLLLSEVVERVSGDTLAEFAERNIFDPLGMSNTRFHDDHQRIVRRRAISYSPDGRDGFRLAFLANWDQVGSGGTVSTVRDLTRWVNNFSTGEVGGKPLQDWLQRRGQLTDGSEIAYAAGLQHGQHRGRATIGHSGSFMGFRTSLERWPKEQLSVIVLSNLASTEPRELALEIGKILLETPL